MSETETHKPLAPLMPSTDPEMASQIAKVRAEALARAEASPNDFDPKDVQQLRDVNPDTNWTIERFVRCKQNLDAAVDMLIGTMKFRHFYQIPQTLPEDCPEEFYKIGSVFPFETDLAGNLCFYMRVRLHRKVKEIEHWTKRFTVFQLNRADEASNGHGLTVVFDCSGAGLTNLDMDFIWFIIDSLIKYYPIGIQHILVYDLPWILTSAWTIIKGWMPPELRDRVVFVNKQTITKYVAIENLPFYMDGKSKRDYHFVPKNCLPCVDVAKKTGELSEKEVKKFMKIFQPYLDEAEIESRKIQQQAGIQ